MFLLHTATQIWPILCWTDGFSSFCRLRWTSTRFSKCGMLFLRWWSLLLRQTLSLPVYSLHCLYICIIQTVPVSLHSALFVIFTSSVEYQDLCCLFIDFQPEPVLKSGPFLLSCIACGDGSDTVQIRAWLVWVDKQFGSARLTLVWFASYSEHSRFAFDRWAPRISGRRDCRSVWGDTVLLRLRHGVRLCERICTNFRLNRLWDKKNRNIYRVTLYVRTYSGIYYAN